MEKDDEARVDGVDRDIRVKGRRDDACVEGVDDANTFLPLFGVDEPALADADFFHFVPEDGLLQWLRQNRK